MARMMPSFCPQDAPPGERALFRRLASSPTTREWVILHSLGIASHVRQIEGEADFVAVVPDQGILVVEVKSHQSVQRLDDGMWILGRHKPTSRSPFRQASEAKHSIRSFLQTRGANTRSVPMLDAVWFTDCRVRSDLPASPEWHEWQILDLADMEDPGAAILRVFSFGTTHLKSRTANSNQFRNVEFDLIQARKVASALRPKFEIFQSSSDSRRHRNQELSEFIDEQYEALDAMDDNQAVIFTGPAGTGKTLLALEVARRMTLKGKRGRLLCFNRLLGRRLKDEVSPLDSLEVGTFHQELLKIVGAELPRGNSQEYWSHELPNKVIESLLESGPLFDFLVIDEVQDLTQDIYLDIFDLLVEGGLARGRVLFFGDFEGQSIFISGGGLDSLRKRVPQLVQFALTVNCRNLPRIGTVVGTFSRLGTGYRRFRRGDDGVDPSVSGYRSSIEQSMLLVEAIQALRSEGFELDEMAVLSPLSSQSLAQTTDEAWLRQILLPSSGDRPRRGRLQFSTIHAFKGLEARAVILTDLSEDSGVDLESLFYVGMTRATDRLYAFVEARTLKAVVGGKQ
jgi:DNA polymerase III delta prime subunit